MAKPSKQLVLNAETAADLMTAKPLGIPQDAGLNEAVALLADKDLSAAPVLDRTGRPVGVLSRTDIVRHMRQQAGSALSGKGDSLRVRDVMTPAFLSVPPATTAVEVVAQLLGLGNVHRLFVTDENGALVGVISARDVLRRLRLA